jgi:hypothetical protein
VSSKPRKAQHLLEGISAEHRALLVEQRPFQEWGRERALSALPAPAKNMRRNTFISLGSQKQDWDHPSSTEKCRRKSASAVSKYPHPEQIRAGEQALSRVAQVNEIPT